MQQRLRKGISLKEQRERERRKGGSGNHRKRLFKEKKSTQHIAHSATLQPSGRPRYHRPFGLQEWQEQMSRSRRASGEVITAEREGSFHKRSTGVINPLLMKELGMGNLPVGMTKRTLNVPAHTSLDH